MHMKSGLRPPRPKRWTIVVIGSAKYLHSDRIEKLLNFRMEYRQKLKVSRLHADQFARSEAARAGFESVRFGFWLLIVIGRRVLFWI